MRRILFSTIKILVSVALLYLALRKVNLLELAYRINVASLGWIGLAIAVTFLQIFAGVLRWREIGAECGAPLATRQAMRFNVIGAFFNQTLPSSIGGDAVRLWLGARGGAGWRAGTYSILVHRPLGLVAPAIIIVPAPPRAHQVVAGPNGRPGLPAVGFAAASARFRLLSARSAGWYGFSARRRLRRARRRSGCPRKNCRIEDRKPSARTNL